MRSIVAIRMARSTSAGQLFWRHDRVHIFVSDILEERLQVDLLLVVAAQGRPRLLTDDGDDRLMIELGIVQSIQEMNRAGSGSRQSRRRPCR